MSKRQIAPWDPFREVMSPWEEEIFGNDFSLAADVYQDKNNVIVEMETPGIESDKLDISVENDVLTVSGSKEDKKETKKEDYYRKEMRSGSFSRSVILPMEVKGEKANAEVKNGVLKVTLPKAEQRKPKRIKVKAGK